MSFNSGFNPGINPLQPAAAYAQAASVALNSSQLRKTASAAEDAQKQKAARLKKEITQRVEQLTTTTLEAHPDFLA